MLNNSTDFRLASSLTPYSCRHHVRADDKQTTPRAISEVNLLNAYCMNWVVCMTYFSKIINYGQTLHYKKTSCPQLQSDRRASETWGQNHLSMIGLSVSSSIRPNSALTNILLKKIPKTTLSLLNIAYLKISPFKFKILFPIYN